MMYRNHIPAPPLSYFVEQLWYFEGDPPSHTSERVLPDGSMQLIINLGQEILRAFDGENVRGPLVCGAYSKAVIIDPAQLASVIGVSFHPAGALPFLKMPSSEFRNCDAALDRIWGSDAFRLRDRLLSTVSVEAKLRELEHFLLSRLSCVPAYHDVVAYTVSRLRNISTAQNVASIAAETGYSQARFIRIFHDAVGLTPKLFSRVQRFQAALRRVSARRDINWTSVALECGYFDQAHFNHDFREFSGLRPTEYLAGRGEFQNHVTVLNESS